MNKKIRVGLLFLSTFLLLLTIGCDPSSKDKMEFYDSTKSTGLSNENVESISLNSKEMEVTDVFGEPKEIREIKNPPSKYLAYDEIEFGIIDEKVTIYFFNDNYSSSRGTKTGDSKEKVIETYGEDYYERTDTGLEIIGYFDKEEMINIEFSFLDNKVNGIMVEKVKGREKNN